MCPLISAPARGYADYQRLENWDSGVLWAPLSGPTMNNYASPVMDVSRYAYLCGSIVEILSGCACTIYWYADTLGTVTLGNRGLTLSKLVPTGSMWHLPNLGPFCQIVFNQITGSNYNVVGQIFASNRVHPLEFIPRNPVLIDQQNVPIGASTSAFLYPNDWYAGSLFCGVYFSASVGSVFVQQYTNANTWDHVDQIPSVPATTWTRFTTVVPPGAWRFQLNNGNVAGVYYLSVDYSTTGAT